MSSQCQAYTLNVSEFLFRLTSEGIRLYSNETRRHQSLAGLVNKRSPLAATRLAQLDPASIRAHLVLTPTRGAIRLHLKVLKQTAAELAAVRQQMSQALGIAMTTGDILSVMVFDYIVEQKSAVRVAVSEAAIDV